MPGANQPASDKADSRIAPKAGKTSAYPIADAALQKAGDLKAGSLKATAKGTARNKMSPKQRASSRG
jgi:hypothetical protein